MRVDTGGEATDGKTRNWNGKSATTKSIQWENKNKYIRKELIKKGQGKRRKLTFLHSSCCVAFLLFPSLAQMRWHVFVLLLLGLFGLNFASCRGRCSRVRVLRCQGLERVEYFIYHSMNYFSFKKILNAKKKAPTHVLINCKLGAIYQKNIFFEILRFSLYCTF